MNDHRPRIVLVSLLLGACGAVVDPGEPPAPTDPPVHETGGSADGAVTPTPPPVLDLEAPRAATTASSLFSMTFAANAPMSRVLGAEELGADVIEQRIVTTTAQPVELAIELLPPTGTYSRLLVSDVVRIGTRTDLVLCESNNIATYDPRCEQAAPAAREMPQAGPISAARWTLTVIDETTGTPAGACTEAGANRIACTLPAQAGVAYRIIASAVGFEDLWDASPGLGERALGGVWFTGAFAAQPDWQCWDWRATTNALYCATRYEFTRFTAVDRARLDFDPITIRITANGGSTAMASPALTWDAGDDDLPGTY